MHVEQEKFYTCKHCGSTLPSSKLWFMDNKTHEGICYKEECRATEEKIMNFQLDWRETDLDWDSF